MQFHTSLYKHFTTIRLLDMALFGLLDIAHPGFDINSISRLNFFIFFFCISTTPLFSAIFFNFMHYQLWVSIGLYYMAYIHMNYYRKWRFILSTCMSLLSYKEKQALKNSSSHEALVIKFIKSWCNQCHTIDIGLLLDVKAMPLCLAGMIWNAKGM